MERESFETCLAYKENLEAVFNAVYDGIVSLTPELAVVNMNEAAETFFGVTREQVKGRSCFCEEMLPDLRDILVNALTRATPIKNFSIRFTDRTGDDRTAIISTALLHDQKGAVNGIVLILHDISEIRRLQMRFEEHPAYHRLIGRNGRMQEIYTLIRKVASAEAPVLIEGESGSGKGLIAEAIHHLSSRRDGPFVKVNCAALSESLLESELFGHVKGAFTGAIRDRIGRFEVANGGTIFLDEIGEIPPATQIKLLTTLQDKIIERVGDTAPVKVDVRIVSATNRRLRELVEEKVFREDLYYRLKVVRIEAPPLRERADDIPLLVSYFVERQRKETGKSITAVTDEAMRRLVRYRWPGNVRELENAIAQAFVLAEREVITPDDLPEEVLASPPLAPSTPDRYAQAVVLPDDRTAIVEALQRAGGKKGEAARLLDMDRTTLWRKMRRYGLD
ncbi:MAG: sigma 54-interacting transcriptional regulator [Nitrospinae bacterium]|nr:sigma 54-interacting transcriptional regulator [Nitrospinota bacterium]